MFKTCICGRNHSKQDHIQVDGRKNFPTLNPEDDGPDMFAACASCRVVYLLTQKEWEQLPKES